MLEQIYIPSVEEYTDHMNTMKEKSKLLKVNDKAFIWIGTFKGTKGKIIKEDDTHFTLECHIDGIEELIPYRERKEYLNPIEQEV
jgi:hypothetical protein